MASRRVNTQLPEGMGQDRQELLKEPLSVSAGWHLAIGGVDQHGKAGTPAGMGLWAPVGLLQQAECRLFFWESPNLGTGSRAQIASPHGAELMLEPFPHCSAIPKVLWSLALLQKVPAPPSEVLSKISGGRVSHRAEFMPQSPASKGRNVGPTHSGLYSKRPTWAVGLTSHRHIPHCSEPRGRDLGAGRLWSGNRLTSLLVPVLGVGPDNWTGPAHGEP